MMKEIYGRADGLCAGKGGSMHIADLSKGMMGANGIVGGGPPLVCGAALVLIAAAFFTYAAATAFLALLTLVCAWAVRPRRTADS